MSWALVLSGGGTAGLAWQTGLLAGLRSAGADLTRPDLVVATSAGAIVGARLACAHDLREAYAAERQPHTASPRDLHGLREAVTALQNACARAEEWPDFPLQIVASDVREGKVVVWTRASRVPLADAVEASCAVFPAMPLPWIAGRRYMDASAISATNAQLAFGHRLVIVIAGGGPHGPLDDEIAQLRAGGSHVRLVVPDDASTAALFHNLQDATRRAAAAEAAYAQGAALAGVAREWLASRDALIPEVDVEDLAERFAVPSLRKAEWTHLAHLAVGAWHVDRYGSAEALTRLRDGIRRLNVSIGGANTETSGYHETITAAYVTLLAAYLDACPPDLPLAERVTRLLASPLADRDALFAFYTRQRLFSTDARARWVDPDLAPLRVDAVLSHDGPRS